MLKVNENKALIQIETGDGFYITNDKGETIIYSIIGFRLKVDYCLQAFCKQFKVKIRNIEKQTNEIEYISIEHLTEYIYNENLADNEIR